MSTRLLPCQDCWRLPPCRWSFQQCHCHSRLGRRCFCCCSGSHASRRCGFRCAIATPGVAAPAVLLPQPQLMVTTSPPTDFLVCNIALAARPWVAGDMGRRQQGADAALHVTATDLISGGVRRQESTHAQLHVVDPGDFCFQPPQQPVLDRLRHVNIHLSVCNVRHKGALQRSSAMLSAQDTPTSSRLSSRSLSLQN